MRDKNGDNKVHFEGQGERKAMRTLGKITSGTLKSVKKGFRPTIKVFLYDGADRVFFFHHAGHVSLPGGGVEEGETAAEATYRELHEELSGLIVEPRAIRAAKVLAVGPIHKKDGPKKKRKKHVWVVGVKVASIDLLRSTEERHCGNMVLSTRNALDYIKLHKKTQRSVRILYLKALAELRKNAA